MPTTLRLTALLAAMLTGGAASAQVEVAPPPHPALDEVVKEYLRLELPLPPKDAVLSRREYWTAKHILCVNGISREELKKNVLRRSLGFRGASEKPGGEVPFLDGIYFRDMLSTVDPSELKPVDPTAESLENTFPYDLDSLVIAVWSKLRGWDELAAAAYARAVDGNLSKEGNAFTLVRDLRNIAFQHSESRLTDRDSNRTKILDRLRWLLGEYRELQTPERLRMIRRLEDTVNIPRNAKPGTPEQLIDNLVDYWENGNDPADHSGEASFWKLVEMGFDAVPVAIEHLEDHRLTRATGYASESFDLTVGQLCGILIYELSGREHINYAWREGDRVDAQQAREWFAKARKDGEEKWLVDHAIPPDVNVSHNRAGTHIVASLLPSTPRSWKSFIARRSGPSRPMRLVISWTKSWAAN